MYRTSSIVRDEKGRNARRAQGTLLRTVVLSVSARNYDAILSTDKADVFIGRSVLMLELIRWVLTSFPLNSAGSKRKYISCAVFSLINPRLLYLIATSIEYEKTKNFASKLLFNAQTFTYCFTSYCYSQKTPSSFIAITPKVASVTDITLLGLTADDLLLKETPDAVLHSPPKPPNDRSSSSVLRRDSL